MANETETQEQEEPQAPEAWLTSPMRAGSKVAYKFAVRFADSAYTSGLGSLQGISANVKSDTAKLKAFAETFAVYCVASFDISGETVEALMKPGTHAAVTIKADLKKRARKIAGFTSVSSVAALTRGTDALKGACKELCKGEATGNGTESDPYRLELSWSYITDRERSTATPSDLVAKNFQKLSVEEAEAELRKLEMMLKMRKA